MKSREGNTGDFNYYISQLLAGISGVKCNAEKCVLNMSSLVYVKPMPASLVKGILTIINSRGLFSGQERAEEQLPLGIRRGPRGVARPTHPKGNLPFCHS